MFQEDISIHKDAGFKKWLINDLNKFNVSRHLFQFVCHISCLWVINIDENALLKKKIGITFDHCLGLDLTRL